MDDEQLNNTKKKMIKALDARRDKDSSNKEVWIVQEFLNMHRVEFSKNEILKEQQASKTDIVFRECNFQIKTIIFPETYKPDLVDKELRNGICAASNAEEYFKATVKEPCDNGGWHEPEILRDIVIKKTFYWANKKNNGKLKYSTETLNQLDLLFYVEIDYTKKKPTGIIFSKEVANKLKDAGWRSISYLFGSKSLVLYIADNAPEILKSIYSQQS